MGPLFLVRLEWHLCTAQVVMHLSTGIAKKKWTVAGYKDSDYTVMIDVMRWIKLTLIVWISLTLVVELWALVYFCWPPLLASSQSLQYACFIPVIAVCLQCGMPVIWVSRKLAWENDSCKYELLDASRVCSLKSRIHKMVWKMLRKGQSLACSPAIM